MSFFATKNQKTFGSLARAWRNLRDSEAKVFCFFFSKKKTFLLASISVCAAAPAAAETVSIDLHSKYGVTLQGIAQAIADAKTRFGAHPGDTVVIRFPAGRFDFSQQLPANARGSIDVSGVEPGANGRLIFQGQGSDATTLVFHDEKSELFGLDVYRISFIGFHMTVDRNTVTQGHVVSVGDHAVVVDIAPGFPSPQDVYDPLFQETHHGTGRAIKRYIDSRTDPHIDESPVNVQYGWDSPEQVAGNRWKLKIVTGRQAPPYKPGDLVCIKSKKGGQAYGFNRGSDITFQDIKWTLVTRGIFRGGIDKVRILNARAERGPPINGQTPCLASAAGGPQIGFPSDPPTRDNVIDHYTADGTGDNSLGFFNASAVVRDTVIKDAFNPGIVLYKSPDVRFENVQMLRTDVARQEHFKGHD